MGESTSRRVASRRARRIEPMAAVLLTLLLGLSACGAAQRAGASGDAASSAADGPANGATEVPLPSADAEREAALVAEGLEEGEAEFLALTTLESEALGENTYRVVATFPTGDEAELIITLEPDQTGDPADLELSHEVVGDDFEFRLAYLVPWDAIPEDLHDEIRNGETALAQPDAIRALFTPARIEVAADSAGVGVIVQGLVKSLYGQAASETARIIEGRLGGRIDASGTLKMLKALEGVGNALGTSAEYLEVVRELDKLEECARNPTNPITQRAYRDDPGYRQRILDQVAETRAEVKANAAVLYLSHLIKTGSSLIRNVPGLSFIVGPGTAWSKAALNEVTRKLIDDLKKNITSCGEDYRIDKTVAATEQSVIYSVHYTGEKCDGGEGEWVIEYSDGTWTGIYGGDSAMMSGRIVVTIPEGALSGPAEGTVHGVFPDGHVTDVEFTGIGTFSEEPAELTLDITSTSPGAIYGFLDTGILKPGTLTFPLEKGDFCD